MTESESQSLGSLFGPTPPEEQRHTDWEYWYWNNRATVGKMKVTRDGYGRFVEFHHYTPYVVSGEETKSGKSQRVDNLGELFG